MAINDIEGAIEVTINNNCENLVVGCLKKFCGVDIRDYPCWVKEIKNVVFPNLDIRLTWIDLKLIHNENTIQLEWNESEKTYNMAEKLKFVIHMMVAHFPTIEFNGSFKIWGEHSGHISQIVVRDNKVYEKEVVIDYESGEEYEV